MGKSIDEIISAVDYAFEMYISEFDGCSDFDREETEQDRKEAVELIKSQQAEIERLQPKKGHWEMKPDPFGFFDEIPTCSECGCTNAMRKKTEFCEHCGADMREGDGE